MVQLYRRKSAEFVANSVTAGDQLAPKVVALAGGGFVMIWTDASGQTDSSGTGIIGQRFDAAGNSLGGEFLVNSNTAGNQGAGTLTGLANGGFLVSWVDTNGGFALKAQLFDAAGAKAGAEFALDPGSPSPEAVQITSLSGGGFVVISYGGYGQVYNAAGAKVGAALDASGALTFSGTAVAAAPGGGFIAVARLFGAGPDDLALQMFDAAGAKVGALKLISLPTSTFQSIGIAALAGGGYAIAWHGDSHQIFALILAADGSQVGSQISVSADFNWQHSEPSIIARPDGGFVVAWTKDSTSGTIESLVVAQAFDAAGVRDGTPFLVSTLTDHPNQNHGQSSVAMLPSGDLVVAWHGAGPGDPRSPGSTFDNADGGIRVQIFAEVEVPALDILASTDSVSETAVENTAVLQLSTTSDAVNTGYSYVLLADSTGGAFRIEGDRLVVADTMLLDYETVPSVSVTVRVTDLAGNTHDEIFELAITDVAVERRLVAGDEVRVNDTLDWNQSNPDIAALTSGGYVVTWTDGSFAADGTGTAVKAQIFTAAGVSIGSEFVVNTWTSAIQEDPAVTALATGGFVVTWRDNEVIKAQILDATGAKLGGEIGVSTAAGGDFHFAPEIASVAGGGFVVAWQVSGTGPGGDGSGQALRMQLFDAAGAKVGGEQLVNSATGGDQTGVALAGLDDGGFVATWTDRNGEDGDGTSAAVKAQRFDAAGVKIGGEILVNTVTMGNQSDPAIVALGSGRFIVTWTDSSAFPNVVKAQIFAADGTRIGGEILITPAAGGFDSSVTALADGGFAVSWAGNSTTPGEIGRPMHAQMFDLNGQKVGTEFEISPDSAATSSLLAGLAGGGIAATWVDSNGSVSNQDIMARLFTPPVGAAGPPIVGTANMDLLVGTQGADVIQGLGGIDRLEGREGDDTLEGGDGRDTLIAGLGDDLLHGGAGGDLLIGGEDDDSLYGEEGDDTLIYQAFATGNFVALLDGGIGDDELSFWTFGFDATATLIGGDGNDTITSFGGEHVAIDAGAGSDFVYLPNLGSRFDISLGAGRDLLQLVGYPDSFVPSAGTYVSDFAVGDGGDQLALAQYLTIFLLGWDQAANPFATGHLALIQRGADAVIRLDRDGAAGGDHGFADLVVLQNVAAASLTVRNIGFAADGSATPGMTIDGTAALDLLAGGGGDDLIRGLGGNDRLLGGAGNDRLEGGAGMDSLTGDVGDDLLYGGDDQDRIGDSHGNDQMFGEGGDDSIFIDRQYLTGAATIVLADGGAGNDDLTFVGRRGLVVDDVTLIGGSGEDLITVYGGGAVIIDGGDGPEIITIDVTASSYRITFGSDPFSSDILRLTYVPAPLTSFTVVDFTTGNGGDMLQMGDFLTGALTGWDGIANPFASGHLLLAQSGADALILIDRDGGGDSYALLGRLETVTASQLTALNLGFLPGPVAIAGTDGADGMTGTGAPDSLYGLGGNDTLDGGGGADDMSGGAGNDTYIVDNSADLVREYAGEGADLVYTSVSYALAAGQEIETLSTRDNAAVEALNLLGNEFNQTLVGNAGANVLNGGGGADVMAGLAGDDTYVVDRIEDQVLEGVGQGTDAVFTSVSYVLSSNQEIETLSTQTHAGTDDLFLTGNQLNNILVGNAGDNIMNGVGGADVMYGLAGDDTYAIDDLGDLVIDGFGQGNDLVLTYLSHTLSNGNEIETLSTVFHQGTTAIDLGGNDYNNTLIGNYGANYINGNGGVDVMIGLNGNDTYVVENAADVVQEVAGGGSDVLFSFVSYALAAGQEVETISTAVQGGTTALALTGNEVAQTIIGNAGANLLDGKGGSDTLYGLGGADTFAFTTALGAGNVDTIADFVAGSDRIGLDDAIFTAIGATINANAFVIGTAAADADDRIVYNSATGALFYDADGSGGGAAIQFATIGTGLALTAGDFTMI